MSRYFKFMKPYLLYFILGPMFMLTEVLGEVLLPKFMANIINYGILPNNKIYIAQMGIQMVLTALMMMCGGVLGNFFATKASVSTASDLRSALFAKVQTFSFKNIDKLSTGSLVTRLTNDITQIQHIIRMAMIMMLRSPGMLIGALIMAISINWKLALIIAIVIPVLGFTLFKIITTAFPRFNLMQKKLDALNSTIQENLVNIRVVKSFVRTDFENEKFKIANDELKNNTVRAMGLIIFTNPVMTLAMNITTIAVVWFGGNFVIDGGMEIGDLSAFTTYIVQILMSLRMVSMMLLQSSRALASAKRLNEIMDTVVDLNDDKSLMKEKTVEHGKIKFLNVCFKYNEDNEKNILDNINFEIDAGSTVGVVGATGCGKTSLVQLIPRLYDVTDGEILVDGINVRDYSIKNLRNGVAMVLQNNVLFSGTVMENLKWGNENASDEDVVEAAANAQADGFITAFSEGYDKEIGRGGVNVSGGQKQRLCIARALLKKPKILILDDSTSAVDTATEAKIRECFKNELKDTTKIIIAQRITSVMEADKIIVMDNGRIVGEGTHEELMNSCREYSEIYYSQKDREAE